MSELNTNQLSDIESRAFRISILSGLIKGGLLGVLALSVFADYSNINIIRGVIVTLLLGLIMEYFFYYSYNMSKHKILLKRLGERYERKLEIALAEKGLIRLLQSHWFAGEYHKKWSI